MRRPTLARVAYHEAGHAVANTDVGRRVLSASIVPRGQSWGRVNSVQIFDEYFIIVCFAGPVAEARFWGRNADLNGDSHDHGAARWAAGLIISSVLNPSGAAQHALMERCWRRAHELVEQRWPEVEAVSAALLERRTLTGVEVRRAIRFAKLN